MPELTKKQSRRDLEQIQKSIDKLKNPKEELGLSKIKARPMSSVNVPNNPSKIKRAPYIEPTVAQNKKAFEFEKRARKNAPTFNEVTTKARLGVNKAAQKAKSITKVQVADKARDIFAINTEVERDYADPTRVNLGDGSKLGDKKTIRKLDYDGTVLKTKTKQVVSKKGKGDFKSGYISINTKKRSKFADEGVENFTNKKTRYRATISEEGKNAAKNIGGMIGGLVLGIEGMKNIGKKRARRANMRAGI